MAKINYANAEKRLDSPNIAGTSTGLKLKECFAWKLNFWNQNINQKRGVTYIKAWSPRWLHCKSQSVIVGKEESTFAIRIKNIITIDDAEVIFGPNLGRHKNDRAIIKVSSE